MPTTAHHNQFVRDLDKNLIRSVQFFFIMVAHVIVAHNSHILSNGDA